LAANADISNLSTQLTEMLINDVLSPDNPWLRSKLDSLDRIQAKRLQALSRVLSSAKEILRYPTFLADYWARFPQDLVRGLGMSSSSPAELGK
jgi:hypothetical protein